MIEDRFQHRPNGVRLVPQFRFLCLCGHESGWVDKAGYAHGAEAFHREDCDFTADDERLLFEARELFAKRRARERAAHPSRWKP